MFSTLIQKIRQVIHKLIPYKSIQAAERIDTPVSTEMINAIDLWYKLYLNKAPWLGENVKSLNLPSFISSEIARQVVLEFKWNITGKAGEDGTVAPNPRSEYLKQEFERLTRILRLKLEQGCASGGMTIKPYPKDGHIYFDWTMAWSIYPIAFGDDGELTDVIFPDTYTEGKTYYTRLERHTMLDDGSIRVTQRAFKSSMADTLGVEIQLSSVPRWAGLEPEAILSGTNGQMFGSFHVAQSNNTDVDSPMGVSVFSRAIGAIKEADQQYSRLLWEFEGSELAIDVDPLALRTKNDGSGKKEMPKLNERLFRGVDLGSDDNYNVFSPSIRDGSLINGLNEILMRVEDQTGLARGTISNVNVEARTATELRIIKQRSYTTIADNQKALETCLRDVVRAMDAYATLYNLAPAGEYDLSFEWDDSIITDTEQQMNERMVLVNAGLMGQVEFRMWYFGETKEQAQEALMQIAEEKAMQMMNLQALLPTAPDDNTAGNATAPPTAEN